MVKNFGASSCRSIGSVGCRPQSSSLNHGQIVLSPSIDGVRGVDAFDRSYAGASKYGAVVLLSVAKLHVT